MKAQGKKKHGAFKELKDGHAGRAWRRRRSGERGAGDATEARGLRALSAVDLGVLLRVTASPWNA